MISGHLFETYDADNASNRNTTFIIVGLSDNVPFLESKYSKDALDRILICSIDLS